MLWRNSWSITGQTQEKLTSICEITLPRVNKDYIFYFHILNIPFQVVVRAGFEPGTRYIKNMLQAPPRIMDSYIYIILPSSCPFFFLSGNQAVNCCCFNSSPVKSKYWTAAYFEQFKTLEIKPIRPGLWKSVQFTALKKKSKLLANLLKVCKSLHRLQEPKSGKSKAIWQECRS